MARAASRPVRIGRYEAGAWTTTGDEIAAEEPLQLLLDGEPLSVIMRTPGNDIELALGLLHAERVITSLDGRAAPAPILSLELRVRCLRRDDHGGPRARSRAAPRGPGRRRDRAAAAPRPAPRAAAPLRAHRRSSRGGSFH